MKLSKEFLTKLIVAEMKNFGPEKDVEDVKAKEVDADELANTLVAKKDFTVDECVANIKKLNQREQKLTEQLNVVRALKEKLVKKLG